MQKKVSFIITNLSSGGAERVLSLVANYFAESNIDVQIIAVQDDKKDYPIDERVKYVYIKRRIAWKPLAIIERIILLRKYIKNSDVVISFLWHVNVYTIIAALFLGKKVIISDRSDPTNELKEATSLEKIARDLSYYLPSSIVFQTPDAMTYYSAKIQTKGVIIPNPVSPYLPRRHLGVRKKDIVAVCRLSPQKNIKMMIDAYALLAKDHSEYNLIIYGDGELREEFEKYVKSLSLSHKIKFPGFKKDIHKKIVDCSMYVSSSDYEGISNSMLEALAMGIPSVITDCPVGGARMFIKNNINGILIPVGDVDAMYKGMKTIIEDSNFAERISRRSYEIREELNPERICKRWLELLRA